MLSLHHQPEIWWLWVEPNHQPRAYETFEGINKARFTHTSRTRVTAILKPRHPRHFNKSHAACIGLAWGANETPIQERRLRFTAASAITRFAHL